MPATLTYPGVYIEEIPSGVHTITGVATSITAFVGRAWKGRLDEPVIITSYADYERQFGGLWRGSTLSYAVRQFFLNGGSQAIIIRVATRTGVNTAVAATINAGGGNTFIASSEGTWGRNLKVTIDHDTKDTTDAKLFNLTVFDDPALPPALPRDAEGRGGSGVREKFLNVSVDDTSPRYIETVLEQQSILLRTQAVGNAAPVPAANLQSAANAGNDGVDITGPVIEGNVQNKTGLNALLKTDLFNLLCIPPLTIGASGTDVPISTWTAAATLCETRRAFLVVDAPNNWTIANAQTNVTDFSAIVRKNAAIYFPRLVITDSLLDGNSDEFASCGVIAGLMSRTDSARGVWKAPAGTEANLRGVLGLTLNMTDPENGLLNPLGINCLRTFPGIGTLCWGARTLEGQDILASEWKYVPIRRLALFLEESLFRGTKWVVFEPNDEPLWAKIRLNVGAFMMSLFRQGAFQGSTPDKAFYVKCDGETTTQDDRNKGIVNIEVGFAPLKPAEFVVIKIQQMAGDLA
jgi:phage tail sheath protein FI